MLTSSQEVPMEVDITLCFCDPKYKIVGIKTEDGKVVCEWYCKRCHSEKQVVFNTKKPALKLAS